MGSANSNAKNIEKDEQELKRRVEEHKRSLEQNSIKVQPPQQIPQKQQQIEQIQQISQIQSKNFDLVSGIYTPNQLKQQNNKSGPTQSKQNIQKEENSIFNSNPQENQYHQNIFQPIQAPVPVKQSDMIETADVSYQIKLTQQNSLNQQHQKQQQYQPESNEQSIVEKQVDDKISEIDPYKDQKVEPSLINFKNSLKRNNDQQISIYRESQNNQRNYSQLNPYQNADQKPSLIQQQRQPQYEQPSLLSEEQRMQKDPFYKPQNFQKSFIQSFKDLLDQKIKDNYESIQSFSYPTVLQKRQDLGECQFNDDDQFQGQELHIETKVEKESFYIGYMLNDQKHGLGLYIDKDDSLYEGYFKHDEKSIYGRIIYRNQTYYEGQWKNDLKNGRGYLEKPEGEHYQGYFSQDCYQGQGTLKNPKLEYEGQFYEGKYHGNGIMKFTTGDKFEGDFYKGQIEGQGTYTFADQSFKKGQWKQGSLNGDGEYINKKGEKYKGQFFNGLKEGLGELRIPGKGVYKGVWSKNKREGKFTLYSQNKEITVNFINDTQQEEL